jgi:hypothetical protein
VMRRNRGSSSQHVQTTSRRSSRLCREGCLTKWPAWILTCRPCLQHLDPSVVYKRREPRSTGFSDLNALHIVAGVRTACAESDTLSSKWGCLRWPVLRRPENNGYGEWEDYTAYAGARMALNSTGPTYRGDSRGALMFAVHPAGLLRTSFIQLRR